MHDPTLLPRALVALAALAALFSPALRAQPDAAVLAAGKAQWKAECTSCHIGYPARFLPAQAWRSLLGTLDHHYGVDASVEPKALAQIATYLEGRAGEPQRGTDATLRITHSGWFVREHHDVPAGLWRSAKVKSASNCQACHTRADEGSFRERDVHLPQ
ncbi:MAG: cytochrome C [Betaproteobacteria bacterium]|nr:cytochrome C [Betaproteobacteria bacterium]